MEIKENKIIFSDKQEITNNYNVFSNIGCNSVIYSYSDDFLLKVLNREMNEYEHELVRKIRRYDSKYFSIPLLDLYIKEKIYGYTMRLIKGIRIEQLPHNLPVDKLFEAFNREFESEIEKLANDRIQLFDVKFDNVLFNLNSNRMIFLDIDGNYINTVSSIDEIYYSNLVSALNVVTESLLSMSMFSLQVVDLASEELQAGKSLYEALCFIKDYLENLSSHKINELGDFARCRTLITDTSKLN